MSWYSVRLDKADIAFSLYVRLRDKKCIYPDCHRVGEPDAKGNKVKGLQASHFHSRRKESTRYDPENVDALCAYHHNLLAGGNRNIDYVEIKKKQLGKKKLEALNIRAEMYCKKDRAMALLIAQQLLKELTSK